MSEEEYQEDEYIDSENDPEGTDEVIDDFNIVEKEKIIQQDEILASVEPKSEADFTNHDHMMEEKVLDALRKGKLR